ncbi:MAG: WYL domain-containing protein [Vulcanimicrobiota bacterium]
MSRMSAVNELDEKFTMPQNSDIKVARMSIPWDFFNSDKDIPVKVTVRFSGTAVRYIAESHFHPTQRIEKLDGNSINFHVEVRSPLNMVKWILSFGSNAKVLEPEQLVKSVKEEISNLHGIYQ